MLNNTKLSTIVKDPADKKLHAGKSTFNSTYHPLIENSGTNHL